MTQYRTPGVYVEEKSTISPSVAGVDTAIPAFIGFTQTGPALTPVAISSLLEYQNIFGKGPDLTVDAACRASGQEFTMYDSLRLFYDNGGADCYVISLGGYLQRPDEAQAYKSAIDLLEQTDEVTLVLLPDAAPLLPLSALAQVQCYALNHCQKMGNRFAILDLKNGDGLTATLDGFRSGVSLTASALSFGAAYYPYLLTSYKKEFAFQEVMKAIDTSAFQDTALKDELDKVLLMTDEVKKAEKISAYNVALEALAKAQAESDKAKAAVQEAQAALDAATVEKEKKAAQMRLDEAVSAATAAQTVQDAAAAKASELREYVDIAGEIGLRISALIPRIPGYSDLLERLQQEASLITPSGAMAGLYAATDRRAGVWQAPANIGVASVSSLQMNITDAQQEKMNVDTKTGKSVNAIRFFKGKGQIVWGSRTLNGNDGEWKYIPVRRLFSYVEQSLRLSTAWAVFQPNDANTWTKIKCQIEGFLTTLWRDGALAGATPDKAFLVEVGLGSTMSAEDIREGNLRVRLGLAAVRPAEFIILEFSHKVQE